MNFPMILAGLLTSSSCHHLPAVSTRTLTVVYFDDAITEVTAAGLYRTCTCFPIKHPKLSIPSVPNPRAKLQSFYELTKYLDKKILYTRKKSLLYGTAILSYLPHNYNFI